MAETEAKLRDMPRAMTRRREQVERNLTAMEARYETAQRELDKLGPVSAPAPPLPPMTAAEVGRRRSTRQPSKAAIIRRLGLRITIGPGTRAQGASRLPFDDGRVQITAGS